MPIELRLMRYVVTIFETGSFEAAAQRLHMTQPPLSRQVRGLERELGVDLFHRRPTRPTEAGRVFVEHARSVLAQAERAVEHTRRAGGLGQGTIKLGYGATTAFDETPTLLAGIREQYPNLEVRAREALDSELHEGLLSGEFDLVFGRCLPTTGEMATATLRREPLAVFVGTGHRLADRTAVALSDLRGDTLGFFPRDIAPRYHDFVLGQLTSTGEAFAVWENPVPGLRNFPVRGNVFMVLPRSLAGQLPAGLVCLTITDRLAPIDLELVWKRRDSTPTVTAVVATAREVARRTGWIRSARRRAETPA
jgi:DNA-binding transcriptional LysR family regulator